MALTTQQLAARKGKLTASAIGAIMGGDAGKVMNLWRELVGDPAFRPTDFTGVWPVVLGSATEELNLDWYEYKTHNEVTRRGDVVVRSDYPWAACTLDGWIPNLGCPIECKHVGGREPHAVIVARYMPQMQWQMAVTRADQCVLSVIEGAAEPRLDTIKCDPDYTAEMWVRAKRFMACVEAMTPPVAEERVEPPVAAVVETDMSGRNEWASFAHEWVKHREAGEWAVKAERALKGMMPVDARRAYGYGVEITRDRAGRLTLKEAA